MEMARWPESTAGKQYQVATPTRPSTIQKRGVRVRSRRSARRIATILRRASISAGLRTGDPPQVRVFQAGRDGHGVRRGRTFGHEAQAHAVRATLRPGGDVMRTDRGDLR